MGKDRHDDSSGSVSHRWDSMKVKDYLRKKIKNGPLHMTLIDPAKQEPEKAGEISKVAYDLGTDAIMVGGSTGVTQDNLDATVLE